MEVAGLLLAAGAGRRMGGPKALIRDPAGTPWVVRTARMLGDAGCEPVLVMVGASRDEVLAELVGEPVVLVEVMGWREGMGASVRAGLQALEHYPGPVAALMVPVDVPGLNAAVVRRFLAASDPDVLDRAVYDGTPGHPVLLGRNHWPGIVATAVGDKGARTYLQAHPPREIECAELADGADVDTVEQLPPGHQRR
jgi:CTP:molybdopterin cytidylyltransferase MocA